MAGRLQGKTALVTAAGQGMGRAAVLAFAREGARVIATDLKAELLAGMPREVATSPLDVLDDAAVQAFVERTGAVDILFNCAGYVHQGSILDCGIDDWDFSFDLNVRSMFVTTKAMLPKMIAAGGGVILNMASVLGSHKAAPNRLAYAASKAAVAALTVALAEELKGEGILVNAVAPSTLDTPANRAAMPKADVAKWVSLDDAAEAICHLASPSNRATSGALLPLYGRA